MTGTPTETIQRFPEEPIFIFGGVGVSNWRLDNSDLVVGEDALAEGVLAVTLFEGAALFYSEADQETH